jgi:hypothetical protein
LTDVFEKAEIASDVTFGESHSLAKSDKDYEDLLSSIDLFASRIWIC